MKEETKQTIIRLKGLNWTWKAIGEAVDEKPETCRKFYQTYKLNKNLPPKTKISRSKITASIGLKIKQEVRDNPRVSVRKLVTIVNGEIDDEKAQISRMTIQRYLTNNGLVSKTLRARPIVRAANILKRFKFGQYIQEQLNDDPGFLNKILWSDETMISCYPHKRKMVVRVYSSEPDENLPLNPAVQGGGFNVDLFQKTRLGSWPRLGAKSTRKSISRWSRSISNPNLRPQNLYAGQRPLS